MSTATTPQLSRRCRTSPSAISATGCSPTPPTRHALTALAPGLTPEMAAAAAKICARKTSSLIARKCRVITSFRDTIGLPGRLSTRLQPNHPPTTPRGIAASVVDGLMYGCGRRGDRRQSGLRFHSRHDRTAAPARRDPRRARTSRPKPACSPTSPPPSRYPRGAPVDLVFQSIAGTEAANASFGVDLGAAAAKAGRPRAVAASAARSATT